MANTYYDSELSAEEIEEVLEAIKGILTPANNGKVLAINNGKIDARSVQWGGGSAVVQPLSVTQNGTYNPPSGVDGYAPVSVSVSGGGGTIDRTLMNYLSSGYGSNGIKIKNGKWLYGFANMYIYIYPADSSGNILKPNWSLPFEIQVQFRLQGSMSRSMVLFGAQQGFYYCPSVEVSASNSGIWCGLSTNGNAWTNAITINSSDGITLNLNTPIRINAVWDGTDYTVTINDGINTASKSVTPSSPPYYNSSHNIEFGGIARSNNHYAQQVEIDLENTYIKQNGDMIWGCDAE